MAADAQRNSAAIVFRQSSFVEGNGGVNKVFAPAIGRDDYFLFFAFNGCPAPDVYFHVDPGVFRSNDSRVYNPDEENRNAAILKSDSADRLNVKTRFRQLHLSFQQIGLSLDGLGLAFKPAQAANRNNNACNSNQGEDDIGNVIRRNQRIEVSLRLICAPVFLALGCWLVYIADTDGPTRRGDPGEGFSCALVAF